MRYLHTVEQHAVLELARVAEHAVVTDEDVTTNIRAAANLAVRADDRRTFNHRAMFDYRPLPDRHVAADERHPDRCLIPRRLDMRLRKVADPPDCIPHEFAAVEQFRELKL